MQITADTRVGDAAQSPRALLVFEMLGIDYCCSAERTLGAAAKETGIAADELLALIQGKGGSPGTAAARNWDNVELGDITRHIVDHFHRGARRLLVDLTESLRALIAGHGTKHPELRELQLTIDDLARDLIPHMVREERYLFPYIETMGKPIGSDDRVRVPMFGTVEYPMQSIRHDHSEDLSILGRIRELSHDFAPPPGACERHKTFLSSLKEMHRQLSSHIHLENDVLFPRAVAQEKQIAAGRR